jgi:MFS family permease
LANAAAALGPIIGGFFSDLLGIHSVFFIGFLIFGALIIFLLYSKSFPREIERVE